MTLCAWWGECSRYMSSTDQLVLCRECRSLPIIICHLVAHPSHSHLCCMVPYGAQTLCTMKLGISRILITLHSLQYDSSALQCLTTPHTIPCSRLAWSSLPCAPHEEPLSFPFIQLFHIDLRPPYHLCSPLPARKHKLCYIFNHVDKDLDPLHHHSHRMYHGASNSLTFAFWIAWNSQVHSGEYSSHVDNSFAVVGQLLDALQLLECKGTEFELDIWAEMKRHKEDGTRKQVSNR
jgi:hypothetical protein